MKRFIRGFVVLALAAGLLSLAAPAEAAKLRIGAHRAIYGSWEVVAHKMGYWKAEGLDYTFAYFKQGKLMRNAIIQGNLDTGTTGFSPFTTARSKGARVVAIAVTASSCALSRIGVKVDSKFKSIKDAKGGTWASKSGTSENFAIRAYVLPKNGLKESDFKWLSIKSTERVAALLAGRAQIASMSDPAGEIAVQKGLVRMLTTVCPYDNSRLIHIGNPDTMKKHPELYEKYFRGWLKSHTLQKTDPEKFTRVYTKALEDVGTKTKFSVILSVVKRLKSEPFITDEVKSYLEDMGRKQKKMGWIKRLPNFKGAFDDAIFKKVAAETGFTN